MNNESPLNVTVVSDPAQFYAPSDPNWQTYGFVSRTDLATPPSTQCRAWRTWALDHGGVDADQTRLYVYLQGKPNTAVLIAGVDIEVVTKAQAIAGVYGWCPAGGASASPTVADIDLDTEPPTVRFAKAGDDFPARRRLLLKLNGTDTEVLQLLAHTRRCDCQWRARLRTVIDGKPSTELIDDAGKPFRTSASTRSLHLQWDGQRWRTMSRADWRRSLPVRWGTVAAASGQ